MTDKPIIFADRDHLWKKKTKEDFLAAIEKIKTLETDDKETDLLVVNLVSDIQYRWSNSIILTPPHRIAIPDYPKGADIRYGRFGDTDLGAVSIPKVTADLGAVAVALEKLKLKDQSDLFHTAWKSVSRKFDLHMCFFPVGKTYSEWFARALLVAAFEAVIKRDFPESETQ